VIIGTKDAELRSGAERFQSLESSMLFESTLNDIIALLGLLNAGKTIFIPPVQHVNEHNIVRHEGGQFRRSNYRNSLFKDLIKKVVKSSSNVSMVCLDSLRPINWYAQSEDEDELLCKY
jgi:hypothetical protein